MTSVKEFALRYGSGAALTLTINPVSEPMDLGDMEAADRAKLLMAQKATFSDNAFPILTGLEKGYQIHYFPDDLTMALNCTSTFACRKAGDLVSGAYSLESLYVSGRFLPEPTTFDDLPEIANMEIGEKKRFGRVELLMDSPTYAGQPVSLNQVDVAPDATLQSISGNVTIDADIDFNKAIITLPDPAAAFQMAREGNGPKFDFLASNVADFVASIFATPNAAVTPLSTEYLRKIDSIFSLDYYTAEPSAFLNLTGNSARCLINVPAPSAAEVLGDIPLNETTTKDFYNGTVVMNIREIKAI
ncbi:MAG: hypothetical protein IIZ04_03870 [Aeriscardovia sp.]|nr:hypothetical protein [Aeriscardovia sp.]